MREILFRGKEIGSGDWCIGGYATCPQFDEMNCTWDYVPYIISNDMRHEYEVDSDTVSEYIGQTDDNFSKIFEHDILKITYDDGFHQEEPEYIEVKWCGDNIGNYPAFDIPDSIESSENNGLSQILSDGNHRVEIVGNIFDNPELLKLNRKRD